jgi:quinolinate synthase
MSELEALRGDVPFDHGRNAPDAHPADPGSGLGALRPRGVPIARHVAEARALPFTEEVERETAEIHARLRDVISPIEWVQHAPFIAAINRLKRERNAVILAHNYQTPEIYHGVADIRGDSLHLAREAARSTAAVLVQAGVMFMAETSKLLNPDKIVLMPDVRAGCSLAASITGADVRALRAAYPGVPVVAYVNTSAEVKAEVDICCTSANAVAIVESLRAPRVLFLPDRYLAAYVSSRTKVEIIAWHGACEVHERFTGAELLALKADDPSIRVIAHPECPPDVIAAADFTGSTAGMIEFARKQTHGRVVLVTECSMADNVAVDSPGITFLRPCNLCPHMKRITLPKILDSLETLTPRVEIAPDLAERARRSVERMIARSS